MTQLNSQFRNKASSTNVLSFRADLPTEIQQDLEIEILGDIAICAPVIEREAQEQGKKVNDHYAHMAVHGVLHLMGYDHIEEQEAEETEALEVAILVKLGFANPYKEY